MTVYVESIRGGNGKVYALRMHDNRISLRTYRRAMRRVGALAGDDSLRIAPVGNPPAAGFEIYVMDGDYVYAEIL